MNHHSRPTPKINFIFDVILMQTFSLYCRIHFRNIQPMFLPRRKTFPWIFVGYHLIFSDVFALCFWRKIILNTFLYLCWQNTSQQFQIQRELGSLYFIDVCLSNIKGFTKVAGKNAGKWCGVWLQIAWITWRMMSFCREFMIFMRFSEFLLLLFVKVKCVVVAA